MGIDIILSELKRDILAVTSDVIEFILFGSAAHSEHPQDIDVAVIVTDNTNLFDTARAISPVLALHTAKWGILISCFPITETRYNSAISQFISNVHAHGRHF